MAGISAQADTDPIQLSDKIYALSKLAPSYGALRASVRSQSSENRSADKKIQRQSQSLMETMVEAANQLPSTHRYRINALLGIASAYGELGEMEAGGDFLSQAIALYNQRYSPSSSQPQSSGLQASERQSSAPQTQTNPQTNLQDNPQTQELTVDQQSEQELMLDTIIRTISDINGSSSAFQHMTTAIETIATADNPDARKTTQFWPVISAIAQWDNAAQQQQLMAKVVAIANKMEDKSEQRSILSHAVRESAKSASPQQAIAMLKIIMTNADSQPDDWSRFLFLNGVVEQIWDITSPAVE
ncbi:MAG: hypothetical protein AAGD25_33455 [Cyanobacteria bacterium P01_F01_bin.150]